MTNLLDNTNSQLLEEERKRHRFAMYEIKRECDFTVEELTRAHEKESSHLLNNLRNKLRLEHDVALLQLEAQKETALSESLEKVALLHDDELRRLSRAYDLEKADAIHQMSVEHAAELSRLRGVHAKDTLEIDALRAALKEAKERCVTQSIELDKKLSDVVGSHMEKHEKVKEYHLKELEKLREETAYAKKVFADLELVHHETKKKHRNALEEAQSYHSDVLEDMKLKHTKIIDEVTLSFKDRAQENSLAHTTALRKQAEKFSIDLRNAEDAHTSKHEKIIAGMKISFDGELKEHRRLHDEVLERYESKLEDSSEKLKRLQVRHENSLSQSCKELELDHEAAIALIKSEHALAFRNHSMQYEKQLSSAAMDHTEALRKQEAQARERLFFIRTQLDDEKSKAKDSLRAEFSSIIRDKENENLDLKLELQEVLSMKGNLQKKEAHEIDEIRASHLLSVQKLKATESNQAQLISQVEDITEKLETVEVIAEARRTEIAKLKNALTSAEANYNIALDEALFKHNVHIQKLKSDHTKDHDSALFALKKQFDTEMRHFTDDILAKKNVEHEAILEEIEAQHAKEIIKEEEKCQRAIKEGKAHRSWAVSTVKEAKTTQARIMREQVAGYAGVVKKQTLTHNIEMEAALSRKESVMEEAAEMHKVKLMEATAAVAAKAAFEKEKDQMKFKEEIEEIRKQAEREKASAIDAIVSQHRSQVLAFRNLLAKQKEHKKKKPKENSSKSSKVVFKNVDVFKKRLLDIEVSKNEFLNKLRMQSV
eukprot:g3674.t1